EIASHSHAHDYRLSQRGAEEIALDLRSADAAIAEAVGARPVGFRAPGYTLSPALLQAVAAQGYRYDSSVFPAAPYYSAKALVKGTYRALSGDRLVNFELHAIDVLDESDGVPAALARQQRDLKVPVREKLRRLREVFGWLWRDGEPVTLAEASKRLEPGLQ